MEKMEEEKTEEKKYSYYSSMLSRGKMVANGVAFGSKYIGDTVVSTGKTVGNTIVNGGYNFCKGIIDNPQQTITSSVILTLITLYCNPIWAVAYGVLSVMSLIFLGYLFDRMRKDFVRAVA